MDRELSPMEKKVEDNLTIILQDTLEDNRKIIKRLQSTVVLLVCLLVGSFIFYIWSFYGFLSQYDYSNTITTTTTTKADTKNDIDTKNSSNTNSSNNINVTIPDIKTNSKK